MVLYMRVDLIVGEKQCTLSRCTEEMTTGRLWPDGPGVEARRQLPPP